MSQRFFWDEPVYTPEVSNVDADDEEWGWHNDYPDDDGCMQYRSCFTCPLTECLYVKATDDQRWEPKAGGRMALIATEATTESFLHYVATGQGRMALRVIKEIKRGSGRLVTVHPLMVTFMRRALGIRDGTPVDQLRVLAMRIARAGYTPGLAAAVTGVSRDYIYNYRSTHAA